MSARRLLGLAGLGALFAGGLTIALASASGDTLLDTNTAADPGWTAGVFGGLLPALTETSFSIALLAMLAGYALSVACAGALPLRLALGVPALLVVAFALAPPLLSSDVFGYVAYARLGALHDLNPYLHGVIAAPRDPVLPYVFWRHPSSPYGPLFTLPSYLLAFVPPHTAVWLLKGLAAAAGLVALWIIRRVAARPADGVLLVGANPLLLVWGVGGAHNDLLVLALVCAAIALIERRRAAAGGATLLVALAVKASGGLLLPFALFGAPRRRALLAGAVLAAALTAVVALVAFGPHPPSTLGSIASNSHFDIDYSGPDALGRLLGSDITTTVRLTGAALVALAFAASLLAMRRGLDWISAAAWTTLAALCAINSLAPWYSAWLLPLAALGRGRGLRVAALAFTAAVLLTRLPLLGFQGYE